MRQSHLDFGTPGPHYILSDLARDTREVAVADGATNLLRISRGESDAQQDQRCQAPSVAASSVRYVCQEIASYPEW
jgi:hypothetical protein